MIIAIDGPAASGKGTLGKRLAHHYGYRHLDTGVIYRAVAYAMMAQGADLNDEALAVAVAVWRRAGVLDVLALGRDAAINLGIDHRREVMRVLVMVSILVAVSTALVGPVTFFGLLVANLAYLLVDTHRHRLILPVAALVAVLVLMGGQLVLERLLGFNGALSIVIEFLGGIVFLIILVRRAAR